MIWFDWILWHINPRRLMSNPNIYDWILMHVNPSRLFNDKFFLYIYVKYI